MAGKTVMQELLCRNCHGEGVSGYGRRLLPWQFLRTVIHNHRVFQRMRITMRKIFQKELDMILHWNLTLVGGFLGTYAILLHAGNFGSAQTGNVMEMAAALTGRNFAEVGIRFLAFLIFGSAIVISYLLTNFTKLDMRKFVLWVDAAGLTVTALMPEGMSAVVSLYPIFFCSAFQWGSYSGASGYNSASIFTTNNFKQSLLAWTQYILTKDPEFRRKGIMYTMTVLSFFAGACIGCVSVYTYGVYGAFVGFVPLIVARVFMYIGKISVENGTPEEIEEEAEEALEEATLLENDQKL